MNLGGLDFNNATAEDICMLIDNTLSGNNQKIATSTKILKAYTKHKSSIRILTFILMNGTNPNHRHMTTVLLKRNLINLYSNLEPQEQSQFRTFLLQKYSTESVLPIQRGIAILIGVILPIVELKNWEQLRVLLDHTVQTAPQSISTFILLNNILNQFKPPQELKNYLFKALQNPRLAEEAMKCLVTICESHDADQSIAIELIKTWQKCDWSEDISLVCLEIFNVLSERKVKLHDDIILWVCTNIIGNKKISRKFRTAGMDFLLTYIEFNGKSLSSKDNLLKKIIETICLVCSEPFKQTDEQGQPVQQIALWLIQTMSINLKSKKIYPILLEASVALINSNDGNQNNTGFLVLSGMAEGCHQKLKKNLQNPVMNVLIPKGLAHQLPEVRGAAINCLSYFSEFLIPEIVDYHATVIPSMMNYFSDMSTKVAEKALIATDVFFDNMDQNDIKSYLPIVIPKLTEVLMSEKSTPLMRNAAISGIGSALEAAELSYEPFLENTYKMCFQFLKIGPSPQFNVIRAQNLGLLGKISNTFCGEKYGNRQAFFRNYIGPITEPIYTMLVSETDPQVRQSCFQFFYLLANAIGGEFDLMFDKIIPQVMKAATLKVPEKLQKQQFSLDSDSEDDEAIVSKTQASEYDEKAAAIHALGQFANACPIKFLPYFPQAYKILDDHYQFFYETIRVQVSSCYVNLTKGLVKSKNNGVIPNFVPGLPCVQRYPETLQTHFKTELIPRILFMMTEDESNRGSSSAIQALDDLVKVIGPVIIDKSLEPIVQAVKKLLESEMNQDDSEEEQVQDDEVDAYIFQPLCDLIPTLAETLLSGFQPSLNELQPYLSKYLEPRDDVNENIQMAGCLSQCFKDVPGFAANNAQNFFQSFTQLVQLQESDLNRNISFCLAQMFQKSSNAMAPYLQNGLIMLKNIYEHPTSHQECKDNALAALCRVIYTYNPPMPYQLFVNNLIQSMPFKGDEQEESTAVKCIMYLSQKNQELIKPHIPSLVKILENDLSNPKKYEIEGNFYNQVVNYYNAIKNFVPQ